MKYFSIYLALLIKSCAIFPRVECFEATKVREKRYLVFPPPGVSNAPTKVQLIIGLGLPMEGGLIVGYVVKHNYNLPFNATFFSDPYVRYERSVHRDDFIKTEPYVNRKGSITRWETYKMFESAFNIFGSGKSCLLRAICEASGAVFNENHGLLGELLHVFLTWSKKLLIEAAYSSGIEFARPSTTAEEFFDSGDQEYFAAELLGRRSSNECRRFATECETSPLEYFTESED